MECTAGFGAGATAGSGYHDLLIRQPFVVTTVEVGHRRSRLPLMRMPGDGSSARRGGATCGQSCANKPEPRWVARWLVQVLLRQRRLIEVARRERGYVWRTREHREELVPDLLLRIPPQSW